jgi:predicted NBD/HSP70 family sugar kinase
LRESAAAGPALVSSTSSSDAHLVTESTGAELRATAADSARQVRGVLDELADPDAELTAHAGTRSRLEGAALALEALSRG